jgi:hypothetical protein
MVRGQATRLIGTSYHAVRLVSKHTAHDKYFPDIVKSVARVEGEISMRPLRQIDACLAIHPMQICDIAPHGVVIRC